MIFRSPIFIKISAEKLILIHTTFKFEKSEFFGARYKPPKNIKSFKTAQK